jgi:hypothetical protein
MESVINIFFIILLLFFVYGYSTYYLYKHNNDPKPLFIPINDKEKDSFIVGGQMDYSNTEGSTCDTNATYEINGDNSNVCLNGGKCVEKLDEDGEKTDIYNCECVTPFAGDNCEINRGVRVVITEDFTSPTEIHRIAMNKRDGYNYFIQDNDYF